MMDEILARILPHVSKPARYTGAELHAVVKPPSPGRIRVAFAYPDVYEVGMSNLGMRILYHVLNARDDVACERVFAPWVDMEALMREHGLPLFTLESRTPVADCDFFAFSLGYELTYTNVLNMLDLAGLPLFAAERGDTHPLILAGGACCVNPEPIAPFVDIICVGEGEEAFPELMNAYGTWRARGWEKAGFLRAVAHIPGFYVPSLYDAEYDGDGRLISMAPKYDDVPVRVRRRVVADLDAAPWPDQPLVPYVDIVHDRVTLELFRGCSRGCRFCQAGMIYRPVREKRVETLVDQCCRNLTATGYEEVSLASLSSGDYSRLPQLVDQLLARTEAHTTLSLPSLRIDAFAGSYMRDVSSQRKAGLTLAPEAGTQRLRDVINKGVTEEDLVRSAGEAFAAGWDRVKLYFMIGLPTETDEDLQGIAAMARRVLQVYRQTSASRRRLELTVSVSSLVPKPHTPFEWVAQDSLAELHRKQQLLRGLLRMGGVSYNYHEASVSRIEAVFARGGRPVHRALLRAWQLGCRFDGWMEHFDDAKWQQAFADTQINPDFYASRVRDEDEIFPWEIIDAGVSREFLWREYQAALSGRTTADCRGGCQNCGIPGILGGPCPCA